jgi:hypothetical protein
MRFLYKYPQAAFPYEDLVRTNARRSTHDMEYELLDTGVFDDNQYFDVFVTYAKTAADDILIEISVHNRGAEAASIRVLPTLWCRNTWTPGPQQTQRPSLRESAPGVVEASHPELGTYWLVCEDAPRLLFTENETNPERVPGTPRIDRYFKDGIDRFGVAC